MLTVVSDNRTKLPALETHRPYSYFVAYQYTSRKNGSGLGNTSIQSEAEITEMGQVGEIEELILGRDPGLSDVVVVSWQLLRFNPEVLAVQE